MSLSSWNKNNIFKFSIDNEHVDETLTDFPVLLNLSSTSGKNNFDCSNIFDKLNYTCNDSFTGEDGDAPNELLWEEVTNNSASGTVEIYNNKLRFLIPITSADEGLSIDTKFGVGGDFDIQIDYDEVLVDAPSSSFSYPIYFSVNTDDGYFQMGIKRSSSVFSTLVQSSSDDVTISTHYALGKFRLVRSGSTVKAFYWTGSQWEWDGNTSGYTFTDSNESDVSFIRLLGTGDYDGGSIIDFDNFTVNSGTIVWPINTNPTNRKLAIVYPSIQEHWVEEYDVYTKLLIHSDTNDGSIIFNDDSENSHSITISGDTHHEVDQSKFGNTAIYFDGNSDWLIISHHIDFNFERTSTFSFDMWIYYTAGLSDYILIGKYASGVGYSFSTGTDGHLILILRNTITSNDLLVSSTNIIPSNTWTHVAVCYTGTSDASGVYLFINGIKETNDVIRDGLTGSMLNTEPVQLGARDSLIPFQGYMDEIRISNEVRWTEDFTLSIAPYEKESILKSYIHGEQEQLFCEIERWDHENEEAQLWVKVPKVLSDQPTDLLLYYDSTQDDNDNYVGDTASWPAQQVWDDNFVAVYHLSQDPSTGGACILDSTSNEYNGTPTGLSSTNLVQANVGLGIDFTGTSKYIKITSAGINFLNGSTTFTLESEAIKTSSASYTPTIYCKGSYNYGLGTYQDGDNNWNYRWVDAIGIRLVASTEGYNTLALTWELDDYAYLYDDHELIHTSDNTSTAMLVDDYWYIGVDAYDLSARSWNGIISKVRISDTVRSGTWLSTSYYSSNDSLITITQADIYQVEGYVKELGSPVQRQIYLYDRASGELMDKVMSNTIGYYTLRTTVSGSHHLICLDDSAPPEFDDLIISKVTPTETI